MLISQARIELWTPAVPIKLAPLVELDDEQLYEFCQLNRDLRIERDSHGVLVLMAPAGGGSSARNLELCRQLANWAAQDGSGSPSTRPRASSCAMARCARRTPRGCGARAGTRSPRGAGEVCAAVPGLRHR